MLTELTKEANIKRIKSRISHQAEVVRQAKIHLYSVQRGLAELKQQLKEVEDND